MAFPKTVAVVLWVASFATLAVNCSHGGAAPTSPPSSPVVTADDQPRVERTKEDGPQTETLPEGPCQKYVDCEDTEVAMSPYFIFHGRKICFWDPDARCACAKELGVDDDSFCERGHY